MRYQRYQRQKGRYGDHCNEEVEHSMSRSGVKITVMRRRTSTDGVLLSSMSCSRNAACASSIRLYHIIGSHISTSACRISRSSTALLRNMLSTQSSYRQCTADTLTLFRESLRACVSTGWLVGNGSLVFQRLILSLIFGRPASHWAAASLAAANAFLVRAPIRPASNSATAAIWVSRKRPMGPGGIIRTDCLGL
jgi:hypothetical protein